MFLTNRNVFKGISDITMNVGLIFKNVIIVIKNVSKTMSQCME